MLIFNHTPDATERLAQAAVLLQRVFALIHSVAPGAFDQGAPEAFTPSILPSLGLDRPAAPSGNGSARPSIIDDDTFSVRWAGRTCRLGSTVPFRLLKRLAQRPNVFIPCDVLFYDVWRDQLTSADAVRSAVKVLRRKLIAAGMEDLAGAIDGSNRGHYALMLGSR